MASSFTRNLLPILIGIAISLPCFAQEEGKSEIEGDLPDVPSPLDLDLTEPEPLPADETPMKAAEGRPVEVIEQRHPNGAVKIRREVTQDECGNYILHGTWQYWDEQGNLISSGQYENNQRIGMWSRVHSGSDAELFSQMPYKGFRGLFHSEATFDKGRLHGKWSIYDCEHRLISEWEFIDGVRDGMSVWYYASGHPMKEMTFKDGLIDGKVREYDTNGKLLEESTYQQGRKVVLKVGRDKEGRKIWEGVYLKPQIIMTACDDWWHAEPAQFAPLVVEKKHPQMNEKFPYDPPEDLKPTPEEMLTMDVKHGRWIGWHPNGQVRVEGTYDNGQADGEFTWWYPNCQKAAVGNFRKGKKHGLWVWWHQNGQKHVRGQYLEGEMTGAWSYWNDDGRLYQKSQLAGGDAILNQPKPPQEADEAGTEMPAPTHQATEPAPSRNSPNRNSARTMQHRRR